MPSDPTMPDLPRPSQGRRGGSWQGRPGYVPPPITARRGGAGIVAVAAVGAVVTAILVATTSYLVQQLEVNHEHVSPFMAYLHLAPWPAHGGFGTSQGRFFLVDVGGVLVVGFVLLLLAIRPAPGGRAWPTAFFASWGVIVIATVASHVAGAKVGGLDRIVPREWVFHSMSLALMWALFTGWLPAAITATANSMRRG